MKDQAAFAPRGKDSLSVVWLKHRGLLSPSTIPELRSARSEIRINRSPNTGDPSNELNEAARIEMLEEHCRESKFTIAFQPIVDLSAGTKPYAYEALVRGLNGEAASTVLAAARASDFQAFDAECRKRAVQLAQGLNLSACLSVNISSETVGHAYHGLLSTLDVARSSGFAEEKLIFEISEREAIDDVARAKEQILACKRRGARIAYDDFGVGYSCIAALLEFMPDILKLDMSLIRGIDSDNRRRSIMSAIHDVCSRLHTAVIAEGIETRQEMDALRDLGINLMQGHYFASPVIEYLPLPVANAGGPGGEVELLAIKNKFSHEPAGAVSEA